VSVMTEWSEKNRRPDPAQGTHRTYTMDEVQKGLNALLAFGGSPSAASKALEETYGLTVPMGTLRTWRDTTHADTYSALQNQHGPAIEQAMVREVRDLARAAALAERLAIEKVTLELEKEHSRLDPAQAALSMSKVKDTNVNKLLALTGRPSQITEHRSANELLRALEARGVLKALPTEGET
jgi:hypothetical protein